MSTQSSTSGLGSGRRTSIVVLGVLAVAALAAGAVAGAARAVSAAATATPPPRVAAHLFSRPGGHGGVVARTALSDVVFPTGFRGFALATVHGATFPALTVDGGGTWRIDGPAFHIPAADAPEVVLADGASGRKTFFAYGGSGGGQAMFVTADAGKHWWEAFLPGEIAAVAVRLHGGLAAFVQSPVGSGAHPSARTWEYISSDGGHHWHLSKALA
jgi:hypothetical protein